ncbi:MAG: phage tail protein [Marinifilaceae bacterium]|jgi:hypothetical protein|nr:phage tail protein [Marinifilaceae bacterium]
MKRQVDKTGGKKWFNNNLIDDFQNQLYKAIEGFYLPYGNCIISGCVVDQKNISEGMVFLNGKIMPFLGADVDKFPVYLKVEKTDELAQYDDGISRVDAEIYLAVVSTTVPETNYITINQNGGRTFRQAFQDSLHRMVTDADINNWNGIEQRAKTDATSKANVALSSAKADAATKANLAIDQVRGEQGIEETSPKWSLKKLYDWVVGGFITQSKISHAIDSDSEEHVASSKAVKQLYDSKVDLNNEEQIIKAKQIRLKRSGYNLILDGLDGYMSIKGYLDGIEKLWLGTGAEAPKKLKLVHQSADTEQEIELISCDFADPVTIKNGDTICNDLIIR